MPSQLHEVILELFRNRPELAPELLRDALRVELPPYAEARISSAEVNQIEPTEYRADLVVLLVNDVPVFGIVLEVQLSADGPKRYTWPVYVTGLRARLKCPVCLLVVTASESVASWAAQPIDLGGGNVFAPLVLGPSGVPEVTEAAQAKADPELAVLSVMAHGHRVDPERGLQMARAALEACVQLDPQQAQVYCDLIRFHSHQWVREELSNMALTKYEYQDEFAKRCVAEGRAEGLVEGESKLVIKLLERRFGALPADVRASITRASIDQLDAIAERLLSAKTLREALGSFG